MPIELQQKDEFINSKLALDRLKIVVETRIAQDGVVFHGGKFEMFQRLEYFSRDLGARFSAYVLGIEQKPIEIELPLSDWDKFKRWAFPGWLLRRFPVEVRTIKIDAQVLLPKLKMNIPSNCGPVVILYRQSL